MAPTLRPALQPLVQRAKPTRDTDEACGMPRLGLPPVIKNRRRAGFGSGAGRQIVGLVFDRTGQEPQVTFCRFSFTISLHGYDEFSRW